MYARDRFSIGCIRTNALSSPNWTPVFCGGSAVKNVTWLVTPTYDETDINTSVVSFHRHSLEHSWYQKRKFALQSFFFKLRFSIWRHSRCYVIKWSSNGMSLNGKMVRPTQNQTKQSKLKRLFSLTSFFFSWLSHTKLSFDQKNR